MVKKMFLILFIFWQKIISQKQKRKSQKMIKINTLGQGGCMCETVVQTEKRTKPSPKDFVFNLWPDSNKKRAFCLVPAIS